MEKIKVIVLYGGASTEHEVSCRSAAFVVNNIDRSKYDVDIVGIDKTGRWLPQPSKELLAQDLVSVPIQKGEAGLPASVDPRLPDGRTSTVVVFPVLHGTNGEDGTLQGMLELADVAYVGSSHTGSSIGMDKDVSKRLAAGVGVPVVPWVVVRTREWEQERDEVLRRSSELGFPLFVKPATLGSSVGITKVTDKSDLGPAVDNAFKFDTKVLVEKGLEVREIECAALGEYDPELSAFGEVIAHADFYSYDAKYNDAEAASLAIPADLTEDQVEEARGYCKKIFKALELYGMARIDLFLEKSSGKFYFNEVNTIPGFTQISQYPMLWKESGVSATDLLDRLIGLAIKRHETARALQRTLT